MAVDDREVMNRLEAALRAFAGEIGFGGDLELLREAVTHSSFANEAGPGTRHNERLEFLGDSVLGLIISRALFEAHPDLAEGDLSRLRSSIVNERRLAQAARTLGLGAVLRLGKGEERSNGRQKRSVLADAFEAVLGALFLREGLVVARAFVLSRLGEQVAQVEPPGRYRDYKTRLQEAAMRLRRATPVYDDAGRRGPDHETEFDVVVTVDGEEYGRGSGRSRKAAQREAARLALERLEAEHEPPA